MDIAPELVRLGKKLREPLIYDASGEMTLFGESVAGEMLETLQDMLTLEAGTAADALVLAVAARFTFTASHKYTIMSGQVEPTMTAFAHMAIAQCIRCLELVSGENAEDFDPGPKVEKEWQ